MSVITVIFVLYLVVLAGLALWSRSETHSMSGYFIAGKKLPPWVVAFSTNATGESGWLLLGLTGMGYAVGAQAFWVVAGEVIGIALAWAMLSRRIKRLADETDSITVPDVLAARFNDRAHVLRKISLLIILVMVGAYVAAQMVATGKAFDGFTDLDYSTGVLVGAAVIILYTLVGGYKAVAWTDLVQGVLMLAGLIIVPLIAIDAAGGWAMVVDNLASQDPGLLTAWGPAGKSTAALIGILSFLAVGLPFMGVPQLMVRFMSARSEQSLVPAMAISVVVILLFDVGAVLTGMAGRALFPGLDDPESILPVISTTLLHPVLGGIMMVVVLAAIMSTVDSLLILASSAVVRDYWQQILGSKLSDRALAHRGKLLTVVIGIIGIVFALHQTPVIFWFVLFAWSGLGAAFGPVLLCALWYPGTNLQGAIAGMLGGFLTTVAWVLWLKPHFYELLEVIPGFIVGLALTVIISKVTHEKT
ncbi:MAG: sodium/proline symporter [Xanthomonadales bacterium]|jgi:sodium/proline symporter|nr:sodium/proline symporter [Xanthomonadales bacterium]MDH4002521.1 sodium/proline symporter [Xanthomonadales bacterium]